MTEPQENFVYPYTFTYKCKMHTLLWVSSDKGDKFVTKDKNVLYIADDIQDAKKIFADLPFNIIWSDAATIDFDMFWNELDNLNTKNPADEKTCEVILNGWNFIEDVLRTFSLDDLHEKLSDLQLNKAYKKFFYGNNIEAVTPNGYSYNPLWEKDEILILREKLTYVWDEIGKKTKLWG